ncbi:cytochrome c [Dyadobacter luteus]|uniref:Cytochrome c n=2 Tax=Dyadobacter luteus TaxID=2259619 RepID=A0A3D8YD10_9BACT|nr:cytochrome c [Dyadobacter luteus]
MKSIILLVVAASTGLAALQSGDNDELAKSISRGRALYQTNCISCHMPEGEGMEAVYPPLAGSDFVQEDSTDKVIRVVKFGVQGEIVVNGQVYNGMMPELGLDSVQVADVINFIKNSWGNESEIKYTTPAMVVKVTK